MKDRVSNNEGSLNYFNLESVDHSSNKEENVETYRVWDLLAQYLRHLSGIQIIDQVGLYTLRTLRGPTLSIRAILIQTGERGRG